MAGTNRKSTNITGGPVIILVEPQLPENIGMVARAMANFGLKELRLVNPRETFPNEKAIATASKAEHILEHTKIYKTLQESVGDLNFLYATTARSRDNFKPVQEPTKAALTLYKKEIAQQKTGILFGRERWGLTNEEISFTNELVTFPVNPAFASVNIAQAVLLMAYEWRKAVLTFADEEKPIFAEEANKKHLYHFFDQLENALEVRGYFRPKERKDIMAQNVRSVFMRAGFSEKELRLLRGVFSCLEHFSPQLPKGQGAPELRKRKKKATNLVSKS